MLVNMPIDAGKVPYKPNLVKFNTVTTHGFVGDAVSQVIPCQSSLQGLGSVVVLKSHSIPLPRHRQYKPFVALYKSYKAVNCVEGNVHFTLEKTSDSAVVLKSYTEIVTRSNQTVIQPHSPVQNLFIDLLVFFFPAFSTVTTCYTIDY